MKNMILRKRDFEIMYYISTQNFASISELHKVFWKSKKSTGTHYRRLGQLAKQCFIEKINAPRNFGASYTITKKGQNILRVAGYHVLPCEFKKDSYTGQYEHDLLLHKVKNILLQSPIVENYIPEYQITSKLLKKFKSMNTYQKRDKIPDGLFNLWVSNKSQTVALELELSQKSKRRYESLFKKHLLTNNWDIVFYIVKDEPMRKNFLEQIILLKRKDILLRAQKKLNNIYFSLVDEFLEEELNSIFKDEKIEFSLKRLEQIYAAKQSKKVK